MPPVRGAHPPARTAICHLARRGAPPRDGPAGCSQRSGRRFRDPHRGPLRRMAVRWRACAHDRLLRVSDAELLYTVQSQTLVGCLRDPEVIQQQQLAGAREPALRLGLIEEVRAIETAQSAPTTMRVQVSDTSAALPPGCRRCPSMTQSAHYARGSRPAPAVRIAGPSSPCATILQAGFRVTEPRRCRSTRPRRHPIISVAPTSRRFRPKPAPPSAAQASRSSCRELWCRRRFFW